VRIRRGLSERENVCREGLIHFMVEL
jgi:hypothetical protein